MRCEECHRDINAIGMDNVSPICGYPVCEECAESITEEEWNEIRLKMEEE